MTKCYQLRYAIQQLNACSLRTFHVGGDLTFDEGGIASRSRFNPVRQYNKDKPNKFRTDLFICADAKSYQIYNIDVYHGRNPCEIDVHESIPSLPTTQKCVLNAMYQMGLDKNTAEGARHIALDNRYQCPELAYTLRERFYIYSTGTCKQN